MAAACVAALTLVGLERAEASGICSRDNVEAYLERRQTGGVGDARANYLDTPSFDVDLARFYDAAKREFPRVYRQPGAHYAGTDAILNAWNASDQLRDERWLAYILATAYHETGSRMTPVREGFADNDAQAIAILERRLERRGRGPIYWRPDARTGQAYFGRGFVQLTWVDNYRQADRRFSIPNADYNDASYYWVADLALDQDASTRIIFDGMIYGWYTNGSHCLLLHFLPNKRGQWLDARRIVNHTDKDDLIAGYAHQFLDVLREEGVMIPSPLPEPAPPPAPDLIPEPDPAEPDPLPPASLDAVARDAVAEAVAAVEAAAPDGPEAVRAAAQEGTRTALAVIDAAAAAAKQNAADEIAQAAAANGAAAAPTEPGSDAP